MSKLSCNIPLAGLDLITTTIAGPLPSPATEALHDQLVVSSKRRRLNGNGESALTMTRLHSSLPSSFVYNHRGKLEATLVDTPPFPIIDFDSSFGLDEDDDQAEDSDFSDSSIKELLSSSSSSQKSCSRGRKARFSASSSSCHGMVRSRTILSSICRLDAAVQ